MAKKDATEDNAPVDNTAELEAMKKQLETQKKANDILKEQLQKKHEQRADVKAAEVANTLPTPEEGGRVFRNNDTIHSDCYLFEVADAKKNIAWEGIQIEDTPHVHYFHTFDSQGRKKSYTQAIAGHVHEVKVTPQGEGKAPIVECTSGPLKLVKMKNRYTNKYERKYVAINEWDEHTHEVEYKRSELVAKRTINAEAVKVQTQQSQRAADITNNAGSFGIR